MRVKFPHSLLNREVVVWCLQLLTHGMLAGLAEQKCRRKKLDPSLQQKGTIATFGKLHGSFSLNKTELKGFSKTLPLSMCLSLTKKCSQSKVVSKRETYFSSLVLVCIPVSRIAS